MDRTCIFTTTVTDFKCSSFSLIEDVFLSVEDDFYDKKVLVDFRLNHPLRSGYCMCCEISNPKYDRPFLIELRCGPRALQYKLQLQQHMQPPGRCNNNTM